MQPVLQWGNWNGTFGGAYWQIAGWYVTTGGGYAVHSTAQSVYAGDSITGVLSAYNCTNSGYCSWEMDANDTTRSTSITFYHAMNYPARNANAAALEAYGMTACYDYPPLGYAFGVPYGNVTMNFTVNSAKYGTTVADQASHSFGWNYNDRHTGDNCSFSGSGSTMAGSFTFF